MRTIIECIQITIDSLLGITQSSKLPHIMIISKMQLLSKTIVNEIKEKNKFL